jgi:hypothetical protein
MPSKKKFGALFQGAGNLCRGVLAFARNQTWLFYLLPRTRLPNDLQYAPDRNKNKKRAIVRLLAGLGALS